MWGGARQWTRGIWVIGGQAVGAGLLTCRWFNCMESETLFLFSTLGWNWAGITWMHCWCPWFAFYLFLFLYTPYASTS